MFFFFSHNFLIVPVGFPDISGQGSAVATIVNVACDTSCDYGMYDIIWWGVVRQGMGLTDVTVV